MYVFMYACMHVCMYVCMYIYIYTHVTYICNVIYIYIVYTYIDIWPGGGDGGGREDLQDNDVLLQKLRQTSIRMIISVEAARQDT